MATNRNNNNNNNNNRRGGRNNNNNNNNNNSEGGTTRSGRGHIRNDGQRVTSNGLIILGQPGSAAAEIWGAAVLRYCRDTVGWANSLGQGNTSQFFQEHTAQMFAPGGILQG